MKKLKITQMENSVLSSREQVNVQGGYGLMGSCVGPANICLGFDDGSDTAANNPPLDRGTGGGGSGGGGTPHFCYCISGPPEEIDGPPGASATTYMYN